MLSGWLRAAFCGVALLAAVTVGAADAPDPPSDPAMAGAAIDYVYLCADCHGGIGEGHPARGIPALAGRPARELEQRLGSAPNHARVLDQLTPEDIVAIADYLSTLVSPPAIASH